VTGPGRPSTGVRVDVRIPADILAELDREAAEIGWQRAELIRWIIAAYVEQP
jgi:metal-responsive CopG/Arc/MetJ family transcriptional regulator